jgi:hypothetical protein
VWRGEVSCDMFDEAEIARMGLRQGQTVKLCVQCQEKRVRPGSWRRCDFGGLEGEKVSV